METKVIKGVAGEWSFQLSGSEKVWTLPLLGSLPVPQARMAARASKIQDGVERWEAMVDLLDAVRPGLTDALTSSQMGEVIDGWVEASGMGMGE